MLELTDSESLRDYPHKIDDLFCLSLFFRTQENLEIANLQKISDPLTVIKLEETSSMTLHFKVPTISCGGCANTITEAIETADGKAKVSVDVENKTVDVETEMSEASVVQLIQSVNHKIES